MVSQIVDGPLNILASLPLIQPDLGFGAFLHLFRTKLNCAYGPGFGSEFGLAVYDPTCAMMLQRVHIVGNDEGSRLADGPRLGRPFWNQFPIPEYFGIVIHGAVPVQTE